MRIPFIKSFFSKKDTTDNATAPIQEEKEPSSFPMTDKEKRVYHDIERPFYTPGRLLELKDDEIFVFGSNLAGMHGGGAAHTAVVKFGAIMGQGVGLQGHSYAIPTMQGGVATIKPYVDEFIDFAIRHPEFFFYVTRIGCGIAGFKDEEIAPLFRDALCLKNVCLSKSFMDILYTEEILKAPTSYRLMQIGQCKTLADIVKSLNEKNQYTSFENLMKDFGKIIASYQKKRGYDRASIDLIEDTLNKNRDSLIHNDRFDIDLFENLLNTQFSIDKITDIDILYTRRMCAKILILARTLNDVCQYTSFEDFRYDLMSLATGRINCGDSSYMSDPYPVFGNCPINWFIDGLHNLWAKITPDGILDNDLMEKYMFTDHRERLSAKGIEAVLAEDYEAQGPCHPEVYYPIVRGSGPVYVKDYYSRHYLKACGEGKGPRSGHELYEMNIILDILDREIKKGEYALVLKHYYIPTKNLRKPIFITHFGRAHFASFEEKKSFIKKLQQNR